jgi:hypothetical protein
MRLHGAYPSFHCQHRDRDCGPIRLPAQRVMRTALGPAPAFNEPVGTEAPVVLPPELLRSRWFAWGWFCQSWVALAGPSETLASCREALAARCRNLGLSPADPRLCFVHGFDPPAAPPAS